MRTTIVATHRRPPDESCEREKRVPHVDGPERRSAALRACLRRPYPRVAVGSVRERGSEKPPAISEPGVRYRGTIPTPLTLPSPFTQACSSPGAQDPRASMSRPVHAGEWPACRAGRFTDSFFHSVRVHRSRHPMSLAPMRSRLPRAPGRRTRSRATVERNPPPGSRRLSTRRTSRRRTRSPSRP